METDSESKDFIRKIVSDDLSGGRLPNGVVTRFPPEPNGYLHLGHAKSICLNFGIAREFKGKCNLRFDDTNPERESEEYVQSIREDIGWLGYQWDRECYASDYFDQLAEWAFRLIAIGKAYVCDLSGEETRIQRGSLTESGQDSPYRERTPEENASLFQKMIEGEFAEGSRVLRAKIDMAHPNLTMRDPVLYRIKQVHHHRTGDRWKVYPTYDFTHGQSDSLEKVTHSICTLEFEDHRPLYNWFIEVLDIYPSRQYEFARLNLTHTLMSKRKLLQLVQEGHVDGWDDPRLPTLRGVRRRGVPPEAIREFCQEIGVTKYNGYTDIALFESHIRKVLNSKAQRVMAVLDPLPITITNMDEGECYSLQAANNPEDTEGGLRHLQFSNKIWIDRSDFMEDPPKKFFRLSPGSEVRLRYSFVLKCERVIKDEEGNIISLEATVDKETLGKNPEDRKVKGVIHWVSQADGLPAEMRLYHHLFLAEKPGSEKGRDPLLDLNPDSKEVRHGYVENTLANIPMGQNFQFERVGYFVFDADSSPQKPVFNQTVGLKGQNFLKSG